jgi:V8-like Glu-specific endopeptidase
MTKRYLATTAAFAVVAALTVGLPAGPASAIIGGQFDGAGHPYVGTLDASAFDRPDGPTGVLISPTILLTAGHVTRDWERAGLRARVTFEPVRRSATAWYTGRVHTNPAYDPQRADDPGDLGIVVFDTPVTGITPATLPAAGLLDAIDPQRLTATTFEVVGYGVSQLLGGSDGGGSPHPDRTSAGTRTVAQQTFNSLTRAWLRLQQHVDGQVCFGDSGSPSLFAGSDVIAGITVGGLGPCRNTAWDQRIDTPAARAFLGQYVTLP